MIFTKKLLSLLLALAMALACFPAALADEALPSVGEVIHGFEVKEISRFDLLGADLILFEHQKTGALVMYVANEDTNRVFDMVFRTPAETTMGVSHVFEHSTLGGSEKYPSHDLFFALSYQTYNTYMNAATYAVMTEYPVASLSEEQLLRYADFYTDSCLHPVIVSQNDASIFEEEAWRYELTDLEEPLTIAGTVYSEMRGTDTIDRFAQYSFNGTLFPGSTIGNDHGGDPDDIPSMVLDDITSYHAKYYHPSNSLTFLYGSLDNWQAFLELLDGYFSPYEKKEFVIEDSAYEPISSAVEAVYDYAAASGTDTANGCDVFYGIICEGATEEEQNQLDLLTTLLGDGSFALISDLREALPSANCGVYIEITGPEPAVVFYAIGVNEDEAQLFKDTVDGALQRICAAGSLDAEAVDAIAASVRLEMLLSGESSSIGVDMLPNIAYYWASTGDLYGFMKYIDSLSEFTELNENGTFAQLIERYLINAERTALVTARPVPGLREEKEGALAEQLALIKAEMTEDELSDIIAKTEERGAGDETGETDAATAELVAQLQATTVASLPEEARIYDITDETGEDGIRRLTAEADADGVGYAILLLNASSFTDEQLQYFKLYTDMIGDLDTSAHTRAQLSALSNRYLYSGEIRPSIMDEDNDLGYTPYLRSSFIAMDEDMAAAFDLVYELVFDTQVDDVQRLQDSVSSLRTSLKKSIQNSIESYQLREALAWSDPTYSCYNWMNGFDYYAFLGDVEALLESDPQAVVDQLKAIQETLHNRTGAVVAFGGSTESAANCMAAADGLLARLDEKEIVPVLDRELPVPAGAEAIIIDGSVKYNLLYADYEDIGLENGYNGALDAITSLVSENYLLKLRTQYGAYGAFHGATDYGLYLLSYRDPNIAETFELYSQLPELIAGFEDIDQETLDGYILSSYSYYAQSSGELSGAFSALLSVLSGQRQEDVLDTMRELKALDLDTLRQYVDMYAKLVENNIISTAGPASAIEEYSDLYEVVLDPFGSDESASAGFTDVPADADFADAVAFVVDNELIAPLSETEFGVDEPAALGDLAVSFYLMAIGDEGWEDAIPTLAAFGIVPGDASPRDTFTREEMCLYTANLFTVAQVEVEEGSIDDYPDADQASEGMAGILGWALDNGLITPREDGTLDPQGLATRLDLAEMLYCFYYG